MICPNCGCTNNDNAEVCSVCGTVLENETQNSDSDNSKKKVIIALISVLVAVCVAAASVIAVTLHKKNQQYVAYPLVSDLSDEGLDNKDVTGDDLSDNINEDAEEIFDTQTTKEKSKTSKSISTTETTKKEKTSTTKPTTTKKFYEGKYYLYADESGELNIYVLQFYGDTVKMTVYDNVDDHPTVAFTDTYKLSWNKAHDYAEINDEIIFIFDDKYKVILYQTANMAKHAALIEYDKVGVSDIIDFASDYL